MANWLFEPNTTEEAPFAWEIPLDRYRQNRGVTIYETAPDVWNEGRYLSYTDLNALLAQGLQVFKGGYIYTVDDATRSSLIASGLVTEANFTPV